MGNIEIIAIILLIAWLGGFSFNLAGNLIHILLVLAVVLFLLRFFRKRTL